MKNPIKSLRKYQGITILLVAALLLETVSSVQFVFTKRGIKEEARKLAEMRLENANLLLEVGMSNVEVAVSNVANSVQENLASPESMYDITKGFIQANPSVSEFGVLFKEDYYGKKATKAFHPASYRFDDGSIQTSNHDKTHSFNYYTRQWYADVVQTGEPVWTDPYLSMTDNNLICTYSKPLLDAAGEFVGVLYADVSMEWLQTLVQEGASAYENAFSVILNKIGVPIVDTRDGRMPGNFKDLAQEMQTNGSGETRFTYNDTTSYAYYSSIGQNGWSMAIVCPEKSMFEDFYRVSNYLILFMILGLLLLAFIMYRTARGFIKLQKVEDTKHRIDNELNIAHGIQMSMIPKVFPPYPERDDIEVFASLNAAKEVGGDLYDFFINEEQLWLCVGDVSGKGVPASLVMAVTRSLFRTNAMHYDSPAKVMASINEATAEMNENNMFVTMFIGKLDLASGKLSYCNAGHNAPVLMADGKAEMLKMHSNLPVGVIAGFEYQEESILLPEKAGFFLYTDGLTEAENPRKELFGDERMLAVLKENCAPDELIAKMTSAVAAHAAGADQSDDLTMLSIRYKYATCAHLSIKNDVKELKALPGFLEKLGLDEKTTHDLNLALEEAATNVVLYAYDEPGTGTVDIRAAVKDGVVKMVLSDSGKPFDPTTAKEPDTTLSTEDRPIGGLGIFLIRKLMDNVAYERKDGKNILTMSKSV